MSVPDFYTVTVESPMGTVVRKIINAADIVSVKVGPPEPHAKAAYIASLLIQGHDDRGDLYSGVIPE